MSVRGLVFIVMAVACSVARAQPAPSVQVVDRQAIYNAAQAAYDKTDWANAAAGFVQLLPNDPARPLKRSEAVIASRYADALLHSGKFDEANVWVVRAITALPQDDPVGLAAAWITEGDVKRFTFEYDDAIKAYDKADALLRTAGPNDLFYSAVTGLAYAGATVDPRHVSDRLGMLLADPVFLKKASPAVRAQIEDLKARADINLGDRVEAGRLVTKAIADSGGLTSSKVSIEQVAIRADAGIISRLRADDEDTRRYFTYTGAGHLKNMSWVAAHTGELPVCGGANDEVRPDDSVVITFVLAADGTVAGVVPVYASRPGRIGETFARAVSAWRWNPQSIKDVEPFWRATLQLELRCVTRPRPQALGHDTWKQASDWLLQRQLITQKDLTTGSDGENFRVGGDDPRLKATGGVVLRAVAGPLPAKEERIEAIWKGLDDANAPPAAYAILIDRWSNSSSMLTFKSSWRHRADTLVQWLPRLQQRFPGDRSASWLTLEAALAKESGGDFAGAQPLLETLLGSQPAEGADDPLTKVALLHWAIGLDRAGKTAAARDALAKSGLNRDQCSLFDTRPIAKNLSISSDAFPQEAQRWGFEGIVQEAFDIGEDGHVTNVRTVLAYPPYIFEHTTERAVSNFAYVPPRLGGKVVGCEGQGVSVNFRLAQ